VKTAKSFESFSKSSSAGEMWTTLYRIWRVRYKIWIGFVLLMIISAGLLSFWWQDQKQKMYDSSLMSSYVYNIMLTTDSTLSNVTLYVPLPVINNTSSVGMDIVEHDFNDDNPSWEYALVNTEHGIMLSMENEKVKPKYTTSNKYSEEIQRPSVDLSTIILSNQTIDTMNPVGNALALMPKYNLTHNVGASKAYSPQYKQFIMKAGCMPTTKPPRMQTSAFQST
jgi:hypothetical protein